MIVEKRSLNWLPRASLSDEMDAAREKRRAYLKSDLSSAANLNASLISSGTSVTGESINLSLRIAAARIQNRTTKKV